MAEETLLGQKIKPKFSMKNCCDVCGLPIDLPRTPVIITTSPLSIIEYDNGVCLSCGHQSDGSTLPSVHKLIQEICNKFIKEREDIIKFLRHYDSLDAKERKNVCVEIPRFMRPNHKSNENMDDDNLLEPYSWNVVYQELICNTRLYRILIRDINWERVKK
jgi:hypothetical protein